MTQTHHILVDTDIGDDIDDALALALVLRSPEVVLHGVSTVFGDTTLRARLAATLLKVCGREDVPVAAGVALPLQPRHRPSGVPQAAVLDPREPLPALTTLSGPQLIIETALAHPGRLTLLCLGPLTNVATALQQEPHLFMAIRNLVMMGGTSGVPFAEWNVRSDARAAQIVLDSPIPITMIGWNVTVRCQLRESDVEYLRRQHSPEIHFLYKLLALWQRHRPRWHPALPYLHDPLAVAALCQPQLLRFEEITARVLTHGPLRGYMVPRIMSGPLVQAAVDIQADEARMWVMQRLLTTVPGQETALFRQV
ncbi:MAG TPA: nucleoside hydrolase [Ktedonobacteraceae bacterium]|nr:nucleoside hydrolase [Ktedonobacteraceae bacterium]